MEAYAMEAYTAEQTGTIQFNVTEGTKLNNRKQELLRNESYDQKEIDKIDEKLDGIRKKIHEAKNARKLVEYHALEARKHLNEAERLSKEYGVRI